MAENRTRRRQLSGVIPDPTLQGDTYSRMAARRRALGDYHGIIGPEMPASLGLAGLAGLLLGSGKKAEEEGLAETLVEESLRKVEVPQDNPLADAMAMGANTPTAVTPSGQEAGMTDYERDRIRELYDPNQTFSTIEEAQALAAALGEGTVMPVKDEAGEVMGWQVRTDVPQSGMSVPDALEMARRTLMQKQLNNRSTNEQNY